MTRTSLRPVAALLLGLVLVVYVGCNSGTDSAGQSGSGNASPSLNIPSPGNGNATAKATDSGAELPSSSSSTKLFANWPAPAGALLISGQQDGYLEPCGCTSGQLGGLRRRYDLIERIRQTQKWPLALVDLGSLIKDPNVARGGLEQSKVKFSVALRALEMMKYDAFALSADDLKLGIGETLGQFINLPERPRVVVANVKPAIGFGEQILPSVKTQAGPVKVGVTAVLDPASLSMLKDNDKDSLLPTVLAPEQALPEVLADLEKTTDAQVLLVQGPPEMAKALARSFPGFDIVVATSHSEPPDQPEWLNDDKTMLVKVGDKGKFVGVVGFFPDGPKKYRYQRVRLISRYSGAAEPMRRLIENDFQDMLKQQGVVENFPRHGFAGGIPGSEFAGAETCKVCHAGTYAVWAGSKHAQAFDDIVRDPKGERSDHQFDAECVSCHTTGFEYRSGWVSAAATPWLKGNQCENCHGPASKHVEEPDNAEFKKAIARTAAAADKSLLCIRCHDEDNSPHFKFAEYWGKIAHKGLDHYDAKAHTGFKPESVRQGAK